MTASISTIVSRRAGAIVRVAMFAGAAALLAGCYGPRDGTVASAPDDYRLRHPIAIKDGDRRVEVFVGAKRGSLSPVQRAEVLAFAQAWKREATGGILIDIPSGTANEAASREAMHEVRSILAAAQIPVRAVADRPYRPDDTRQFSPIRLNYPRVVAEAGPCGLWPEDLGPTADRRHLENKPYWNLGCATQRNLASMISEPADLVQPRAEGPAYNGRRTTGLEKYRAGQSTATIYPDAGKGQISEIGQ